MILIPIYDVFVIFRHVKRPFEFVISIFACAVQIFVDALLLCPVTVSRFFKLNIYSEDSYDFFYSFIREPSMIIAVGLIMYIFAAIIKKLKAINR